MTSLKRLIYLFAVLLTLNVGHALASSEVRIGVLAWQGAEEAEVQWASLVQELKQKLPGRRIALRHFDLTGMAEALKAEGLDFVITNPGHYVVLEAEYGVSRIATQVAETSRDPAHVVGSAVVVLNHRQELQGLKDLKGRSLAAVSPDAFGGYQVVWAELRHQGLDPERGNVSTVFTGFPMPRVIEAVLKGDADAGVLRACLLERLEREGAVVTGVLRVLSPRPEVKTCQVTSLLYPGWAFAAARETAPELSRQVLLALLSMAPEASGHAWTVPADYHPVHELFRELQIGPYSFLRETDWRSLARQYWPAAAGLGLMLLLWVFYTLRVEQTVQRRTRELTAALVERHQLQDRVQAGQQQMEHLSRLSILGELAGSLAHELNQPLAAIGNYARSLLRRQERNQLSPEALRQAAEEISSESERAAGILSSIRTFARKRPRVREERDLAQLVRESISLIRGMLNQAPAVSLHDELPLDSRQAQVDPLQIQQVLLNLLKNAWDAQQAAGIDTPIEVRLSLEDDRFVVAVRDHGGGISSDLQAHLFEAFFTTKPDGLGLGLSICKTIIEAHGGELLAQTPSSGPGMIFRFSLPGANTRPEASSTAMA